MKAICDRIEFINYILNSESNDPDVRMAIIRDKFINIMSCYNIALSYGANDVKIIEHSPDYNMILLQISADPVTVEHAIEILNAFNESPSNGLHFDTYDELFCATLTDRNENDSSFTVKIIKW